MLQVCLEGGISQGSVMKSLSRGRRASGDLIPWTISQQFADSSFASLSGARVVRIAVHPDLQVTTDSCSVRWCVSSGLCRVWGMDPKPSLFSMTTTLAKYHH